MYFDELNLSDEVLDALYDMHGSLTLSIRGY